MSSWTDTVSGWERTRLRRQVFATWGHDCYLCGQPADTVDHVTAVANGGAARDLANLRPCCRRCNLTKGASRRRRRSPRSRAW